MNKLNELSAKRNQNAESWARVTISKKKILTGALKGSVLGGVAAFLSGELFKAIHLLRYSTELKHAEKEALINFHQTIIVDRVDMSRYIEMVQEIQSYIKGQFLQLDNFPKVQFAACLSIFGAVTLTSVISAYLKYKADKEIAEYEEGQLFNF